MLPVILASCSPDLKNPETFAEEVFKAIVKDDKERLKELILTKEEGRQMIQGMNPNSEHYKRYKDNLPEPFAESKLLKDMERIREGLQELGNLNNIQIEEIEYEVRTKHGLSRTGFAIILNVENGRGHPAFIHLDDCFLGPSGWRLTDDMRLGFKDW